ncbi:MAG: ArsR family transcriptional regulator [Methanobacteriota archaeon]|nr:MAG: ArsR family transcriptional regulator [Euryarchaeota archaeon]
MAQLQRKGIMEADDMLSRLEEHFHVLPLGEKSHGLGKVLSTETGVRVLEAVYRSDPDVGVSAAEISKRLGVGRTTVLYHLGRMLESGLVEINPVLKSEEGWRRFWNLYRSGGAHLTKEQFNHLHEAHMNGIKLFVPRKKGFLVLPSTDAGESRSMMLDLLSSITAPVRETDYGRLKKTSSLLGTVGVLLIALSFLFQTPLFSSMAGTAPATGRVAVEEAAMYAAPAAPSSDAAGSSSVEKSMVAGERAPAPSPLEERGVAASPVLLWISRASLYLGILFSGSAFGFLVFWYSRRR